MENYTRSPIIIQKLFGKKLFWQEAIPEDSHTLCNEDHPANR
jgi:hypothetical protein